MRTKSLAFWYVMFIWVLSFCCIKGFSTINLQNLQFDYCIIGYFVVTRFIIRPLATRSFAHLKWTAFIPILQDYEYLDSKRSKIIFVSCYAGAILFAIFGYFFFADVLALFGVPLLDCGSSMIYMFILSAILALVARGVFAVNLLQIMEECDDYSSDKKIGAQIFRLFSRLLAFIPVLRTMTFLYMMLYDIRLGGSE